MNLRVLWAIARNDLRIWRRSPAAIAAALVPPLAMAGLVAMLTASATQQPVAMVVEGGGPMAQRFAHAVAGDVEAYALHVTDAATAAGELAAQRVAAVIVVPPDFDERVAAGDGVVGLTLNNVDSDFSDDIRRTVDRSVAQFDAPQLGYLGEQTGAQGLLLPNVYRIAVAEHDLRQTTVDFLHYNLVPVLILLVINVGMLGTALLVSHDIERGTARTATLTPVSRSTLVLGRVGGGVLATFAVLLPVVVPATAFGVLQPALAHWLAVAVILMATTVVAVGLGLLLAVALRQARSVAMGAVTVATYLFLLGGGFTTLVFLPGWIQALSHAVPTSYAIDGLRQALFYPDIEGFGGDVAALAVAAALALGAGTMAMNRTWRRAR
jgi:ABC-2 type transport system permease protein